MFTPINSTQSQFESTGFQENNLDISPIKSKDQHLCFARALSDS